MSKIINFFKISLIFILISSCAHKFESADLVVHNAKIFTTNKGVHQEYQAIAIKNGIIIDIGPERDILNKYHPNEQYDARKRVILAGFIPVFNTVIKDSLIFWENGFTSFSIDSLNLASYKTIKNKLPNSLFSIACNVNNIEENLLFTETDTSIKKIIYTDTNQLNNNYTSYLPPIFISNTESEITEYYGQQYTLNNWEQSKFNIVHTNKLNTVEDDKSFTLYYDNNKSPFKVIEKLVENKSVLKAIDNFTLNSAILNNLYDNYGSLEIGKKANFITLDYNIFKAENKKIHKIKILHTYVEGKIKYKKY